MELRGALSRRQLSALAILSLVCLLLFGFRVVATETFRYWFVPENLALAWVSLFFSWLLVGQLRKHRWLSWQNIALSVLWIIFLPNTWYVLTDFIHVYSTGEISELYDIVLISSLVINGFTLGFIGLYMIHKELLKRFDAVRAGWIVTLILLISSFGIYLGRDLRWNAWDVLTNPAGLAIDVSDRVIDPLGHPRAFNITGLFFVLLGTSYWAICTALPPSGSLKKK